MDPMMYNNFAITFIRRLQIAKYLQHQQNRYEIYEAHIGYIILIYGVIKTR